MVHTPEEIIKSFGFIPETINDQPAWVEQQLKQGKSLGIWTDGFEVRKAGGSPDEIGEINSCQEALQYFSEGHVDYFVCEGQVAAFPALAYELLGLMVDLVGERQKEAEERKAIEIPDYSQQVEASPFLINLWGKLLALGDNYSESGSAFRSATALLKDYSEPYGNLGTLLWKVGQQREAFVLFTEALLKAPYIPSIQLNFFDAGYELQEYEAMIKVIENIEGRLPGCLELQHHLAVCHWHMERPDKAISILQDIVSDHPNDKEAKDLVAHYLAESKAGTSPQVGA